MRSLRSALLLKNHTSQFCLHLSASSCSPSLTSNRAFSISHFNPASKSGSDKSSNVQTGESELEKLKRGLQGGSGSDELGLAPATDYESEALFPSDLLAFDSSVRDRTKGMAERARTREQKLLDAGQATVVLFPGQGAQFVGMGKRVLADAPEMKALWEEASSVLGFDLLKTCIEGPQKSLDATRACQPATVVTSLAALRLLARQHPEAIENCVATAGFSVGEYAALVFGGHLSFSDALKVVRVRCEEMQRLSDRIPSGMLTVMTNRQSTKLLEICAAAKEHVAKAGTLSEAPICQIANYLFPEGKVLAGHMQCIKFVEQNAKKFGLVRARQLPVSGAFHTRLMEGAAEPLRKALASATLFPSHNPPAPSGKGKADGNTSQPSKLSKASSSIPLQPAAKVFANVDARTYHVHNTRALIAKLSDQVWQPVRWEQSVHGIYDLGGLNARDRAKVTQNFPFKTYELGPGKQLGAMLKSINAPAHAKYTAIAV